MNRRHFLRMLGLGALSAPLAVAAAHAQPAAAEDGRMITRKVCSVPHCPRWARARGRCDLHLAIPPTFSLWLNITNRDDMLYAIGPEVVLPIGNRSRLQDLLADPRFQPGDPS